MKKRPASFTFIDEIYNARVHILYLQTNEEVKEYFNKNFPGAVYNRNSQKSAYSCALECDGYTEYLIDFILAVNNRKYLQDTIAHESYHIVQYIFDDRGVKSDRNNPEPEAYYLGYLVRKITEGIFSK
jgi:hypothetical protein